MQSSPATVQPLSSQTASSKAQLRYTYLGWEISLSRVFKERTDKGLWLHWYHPADRKLLDQEQKTAVRYGYFVAPTQPLEEALHAVYQSIDAIVELESMETETSLIPQSNVSAQYWQKLPIAG